MLKRIHHVAVICSDYARSRVFYVDVLGLRVVAENYREARDSYKLDLELPDGGQIEFLSFPNPPERVNNPEAAGLRHLAFAVDSVEEAVAHVSERGVDVEAIRVDEHTGKKYTFFKDPDGLPMEFYEG